MKNKARCNWSTKDQMYIDYHDEEWGCSTYDDNKLFEYLILEGMQAGLSWLTILKKRENYRILYDDFDPLKVANYNEAKKLRLLEDTGIIRNKLKIEASVTNAQAFLNIQKEFCSFKKYIWQFVNNKPIQNAFRSIKEIPAKTKLSYKISKDLKKRGFKFIGSTIIYAHIQATGMVNDHVVDCFRYKEVANLATIRE